jgi:homogentisate 1,2-dioxygenase
MTPHGPDTATFAQAIRSDNENPTHLPRDALAFMFEVSSVPRLTPHALGAQNVDQDYYTCWIGLKSHFDPRTLHPSIEQRDKENSNGERGNATTMSQP